MSAVGVAQELGRPAAVPLVLWGRREGAAPAPALARLLEGSPSAARRVLVGGVTPDWPAGVRAGMDRTRALSDQEVAATLQREGAYVEFDGLKPERARRLGPAYRHDVLSSGSFLLAARRPPCGPPCQGGIELVVAEDGPEGPVGDRGHGHWDWRLFSGEVTQRRAVGCKLRLTHKRNWRHE